MRYLPASIELQIGEYHRPRPAAIQRATEHNAVSGGERYGLAHTQRRCRRRRGLGRGGRRTALYGVEHWISLSEVILRRHANGYLGFYPGAVVVSGTALVIEGRDLDLDAGMGEVEVLGVVIQVWAAWQEGCA